MLEVLFYFSCIGVWGIHSVHGVEKAAALTNTAGLRATLLQPAHRQHRARRHRAVLEAAQNGVWHLIGSIGFMQTIAGFPSNLFAFMKIQLKTMRICVCFHQLCNANKRDISLIKWLVLANEYIRRTVLFYQTCVTLTVKHVINHGYKHVV